MLVIGATGYTGSGIADALVAAGHRVSCLARSDESARKLEERHPFVRDDITDAGSLREATRGAEAVVHTALMQGERTVIGAVLYVCGVRGRRLCTTAGCGLWRTRPKGSTWPTRRRG